LTDLILTWMLGSTSVKKSGCMSHCKGICWWCVYPSEMGEHLPVLPSSSLF